MKIISTFFLFLFISISSIAQWSSNPNENLQVCDVSGEQVLPKIGNTSDNGCFISWFDNRASGYAVYVQRLNALGEKQFTDDGLLVSGNPQSSSLVDWDMIVDDSDNAIIVFTDTRNGGSINPFAYKISSSGNFLWGENGVSLSTSSSTYQPNPKVAQTSDGNYVVTWVFGSTPNKIAMQKLSRTGFTMWGDDPIYLTGITNENYTYPSLVSSDSGSVIMYWAGYQGSFISPQNYHLYSQKFSPSGNPLWSSNPDTVYKLGRVAGFYTPKIFPDGNNGALYVWHDDRNSTNLTTGFVQHFSSSGEHLFPENGVAGSINASQHHFDPMVAYNSATSETYMFWKEANSLQSQFGVYGQKFSANGTRIWNDEGKVFKAMDENSFSSLSARAYENNVMVYYNELPFSGVNDVIKSFMIDSAGNMQWGGNILTVSGVASEKLRLNAVVGSNGMSKLVWTDKRNDAGGLYAQNINPDGTFGNVTGVNDGINKEATKFLLAQNYPNPFNPSTRLSFVIGRSSFVTLKVFNILGNEVATLVNETKDAGNYSVQWNAEILPSGMYFYRLATESSSETKRMMLTK
ncbi:MAG: T9SS type A sorting domain-containing protein [Ignavibacteriales bacterium]|nr:T9SS type A sorting domain-containing protein [Ignavibacteriales bacterium]